MIYSYTNTDQAVVTDGGLVYNVDEIKTGCTVAHTAGTSPFTLNRPGYYYVTVTAVAGATTTGDVQLTLYNKSTPVDGALATANSTGLDNVVDLTLNAIIKVLPSCCAIDNTAILTVVNTGVDATYSNTTISITKIA